MKCTFYLKWNHFCNYEECLKQFRNSWELLFIQTEKGNWNIWSRSQKWWAKPVALRWPVAKSLLVRASADLGVAWGNLFKWGRTYVCFLFVCLSACLLVCLFAFFFLTPFFVPLFLCVLFCFPFCRFFFFLGRGGEDFFFWVAVFFCICRQFFWVLGVLRETVMFCTSFPRACETLKFSFTRKVYHYVATSKVHYHRKPPSAC